MAAGTTRKTDRIVAEWLRQRNPGWTAAQVNWQIARSYVIDDHPDWDDAQIDREVTRRLTAEEEGKS